MKMLMRLLCGFRIGAALALMQVLTYPESAAAGLDAFNRTEPTGSVQQLPHRHRKSVDPAFPSSIFGHAAYAPKYSRFARPFIIDAPLALLMETLQEYLKDFNPNWEFASDFIAASGGISPFGQSEGKSYTCFRRINCIASGMKQSTPFTLELKYLQNDFVRADVSVGLSSKKALDEFYNDQRYRIGDSLFAASDVFFNACAAVSFLRAETRGGSNVEIAHFLKSAIDEINEKSLSLSGQDIRFSLPAYGIFLQADQGSEMLTCGVEFNK